MIEIRPKDNSADALRLDEKFLWWQNEQIPLEDIFGIAFSFSKGGGNLGILESRRGYVALRTSLKTVRITATTYNFFGRDKSHDNMKDIVNIILRNIGPRILARLVHHVFVDRQRIVIGSLCIAVDGIAHRSLLGGETFVPWSWSPSVFYGTTMHWKWSTWSWWDIPRALQIHYIQTVGGPSERYDFKNRKSKTLCTVLPNEENAFAVEPLLDYGVNASR